MSHIIVAGKEFPVETKVITWREAPFWDATVEGCTGEGANRCTGGRAYSDKPANTGLRRYGLRPPLRRMGKNPTLEAAQAVINQFVIHHDGVDSARTCWKVLHNERGLSCHFLMDNDGTIYQTLDLALMGYHAAEFNGNSVGIELCNRGDARRWPDFYDRPGRKKREITTARIHGHVYKCFRFTPEQLEALKHLVKAMTRALPNMPIEYPQDTPGHQAWKAVDNVKNFAGLVGHYHLTRAKWDPGPFDFKEFCEGARGSLCFPVFAGSPPEGKKIPEIPQKTEELRAMADKLYATNERGEAGHFPIGPGGEIGAERLWHGGVHLEGKQGAPVLAPFPGRILAARMGPDTAVGSTNFVLMRHDMTVGKASVRFFTLYFHLLDESRTTGDKDRPKWLDSDLWSKNARRGQVVLLDEPVEAGWLIGRVGKAGPLGERETQIHFEIFSAEDVSEAIEKHAPLKANWTLIDGTSGGRFTSNREVLDAADGNRDGSITRQELLDFVRGSHRRQTQWLVTLSVSEWIDRPSWYDSLMVSPEFRGLGEAQVKQLVEEQIAPTIWWTDKVAKHAKLPRDGVVYHYHPITFVKYVNEKLQEANALAHDGLGAFQFDESKPPPADIIDDISDESGASFVTEAELTSEDMGDELTLEDLVKGFPDE